MNNLLILIILKLINGNYSLSRMSSFIWQSNSNTNVSFQVNYCPIFIPSGSIDSSLSLLPGKWAMKKSIQRHLGNRTSSSWCIIRTVKILKDCWQLKYRKRKREKRKELEKSLPSFSSQDYKYYFMSNVMLISGVKRVF